MQLNASFSDIQETKRYIQALHPDFIPRLGLVLGTGLGGLAAGIEAVATIAYKDLPHFPVSTVESHAGQLILGYWAGVPVAALAGRFHYYEGYSAAQITFPVRVLHALGIERLILSNASGGLAPDMQGGDLVFIEDHINLQPDNPLRGINDERLGPRFPEMQQAYDPQINQKALELARSLNLRARTGIYVGVQGPNMETPAEYRYFRIIGGDVVGMSTVPEVLVAAHCGLPVFVVSVVANLCIPPQKASLQDVIRTVQGAEPGLTELLRRLIKEL